jgi:hypothetical protein
VLTNKLQQELNLRCRETKQLPSVLHLDEQDELAKMIVARRHKLLTLLETGTGEAAIINGVVLLVELEVLRAHLYEEQRAHPVTRGSHGSPR